MFPMVLQGHIRNPRRNRVSTQVQSWTSFTPLSLAPVLWLDAADTSTITSSSGAVSQWNDKSGNGYNVTQSTGAAQPGTGSVTLNGLNVLTFNGSQRLAASTASDWTFMHDGTKWFASIALQAGTSSDPQAAYGPFGTASGSSSSLGFGTLYHDIPSNNNAVGVYCYRGVLASYVISNEDQNIWTPNTFALISLLLDPSNGTASNRSSVRVNGSSEYKNNTQNKAVSSSNPTNPLTVGAWGDNAFGFVGRIAEVIIVKGAAATDTNRQLIRDYLNTKWAIY